MGKVEKIVIFVLCVFLAVTTVGTFFLYNENVGLKTQVQFLEHEKLSLQSQVEALQKERADLQTLVDALRGKYDELQAIYEALKLNYTSLSGEYALLSEEFSSLQLNYTWLNEKYGLLNEEYSSLQKEYSALEVEHSALEGKYQSLNERFNSLSADYAELQSSYESLSVEYAALQTEYGKLAASYNSLVENYGKWLAYAKTYFHFTKSFGRTLSESEILSLVSTVESVVSNPNDWWRSVKQLYGYVVNKIRYVSDEPFPAPPTIHEFEANSYRNTTSLELFLSPTETLELGQGDCDDQAVLLYGLVKAYNKHVYGKYYTLWIMYVVLGEGAHLSVAFPVSGGELTIIDPAGHYYTGWLTLTSNDPYNELENYSRHWSSNGGVKHIILYRIDGGVAYKVASGNIQEVADYIEKHW